MKLNFIEKLQQGGAWTPPYAVYTPLSTASENVAVSDSDKSSKSSSSGKSENLTDKDIVQLLKEMDGLPSDMAVLTNKLQNFYLSNDLPGLDGNTINTSNIAVRYLGIINQLKVAKFNKQEYDNAYKHVESKGGLNEYAITDRGQFICMNKNGEFKTMTPEELRKAGGKYTPLTNSELLYQRAQDVTLANKNQLLSVVQNGIGMETVTNMINQALGKLGTSEASEEGYTSTKQGRMIRGLKDFAKAVQEADGQTYDGTVNELYKSKYLTKDQKQQAAEAFAYIYNTLPANAKALLKSKSDLTDEGAKKLIQTLIASQLSSTTQFDLDFTAHDDGTKSGKKGKSGKGSGDNEGMDNFKDSQLIEFVKGIGGVEQPITVDRGDGVQMSVTGKTWGMVTDLDGKAVGNTSLRDMMTKSGIANLVKNNQSITFGDQKISPDKLKNITYNDTGLTRAILPIKSDGSVDFSLLDKYRKFEAQLALSPRMSTTQKNALARKYGLYDVFKADGSLNEHKFGIFLVTEGYTTDKLSGVKDSSFVKEYKGDTDSAVQLIKDSLATKTADGKKLNVPDIDERNWWNPVEQLGYHYDKVYKAAIYIPIDDNVVTAARTDGQKLDYYDEASEMERRNQNKWYVRDGRAAGNSSDVLNN